CRLTATLERTPLIVPNSVLSAASASVKTVIPRGGDLDVSDMASLCAHSQPPSEAELQGLGPQRSLLIAPSGAYFIVADLNVPKGAFKSFLDNRIMPLLKAVPEGVRIDLGGSAVFLAALQRYSDRIGVYIPFVILIIG